MTETGSGHVHFSYGLMAFCMQRLIFTKKPLGKGLQIGLGGGPRTGKENPFPFYLHQGRKSMKLGAVEHLEVCEDWAAQKANNQAVVFSNVGSR